MKTGKRPTTSSLQPITKKSTKDIIDVKISSIKSSPCTSTYNWQCRYGKETKGTICYNNIYKKTLDFR